MGRTKPDKAQKAHPAKPKPSTSSGSTSSGVPTTPNASSKATETKSKSKDGKKSGGKDAKKSKKSSGSVTDPMKALGGDEADLELIEGADAHADQDLVTGDAEVEAGLVNDVGDFLKKLTSGGGDDKKSKKDKKKKARDTNTADTEIVDLSSSKKSKKADRKQAEPSASSSKTTPPDAPQDSQPKPPPVVLPKQVTLSSNSKFICPPSSKWHSNLAPLSPPSTTVSPSQLAQLTTKASSLHETDLATYQASSSSSSEAAFLQNIIGSGTLSDRLSALTLLVQSSPIHNVKALMTLKGMAERGKGQGGRGESLKALRCVVDWWVGGGAPDRKLKYFRDQPLGHPDVTDEHLLVWYFEDWLKKYFFSILQVLETVSLDPLSYVRTQTLTLISTLLREKPEQEHNLLRLLVNKLGDTEKPVCARASHNILQILQVHPSMKAVIVREMTALVMRPPAPPPGTSTSTPAPNKVIKFDDEGNAPGSSKTKPNPLPPKKKGPASTQTIHTRYYAAITFNQIVLVPTPAEKEVAMKLVDVYFEMFREVVGERAPSSSSKNDEGEGEEEGDEVKVDKKGRIYANEKKKGKKGKEDVKKEMRGAGGFAEVEDADSKLVSAILTGVNRAVPFVGVGDGRLEKHIDTLFLITHTSTFNTSLQALVLIQQIASAILPSTQKPSSNISDRYHRTLYASLLDPRLLVSSKQAMYLNLLFKSIKADGNAKRRRAVVRRFLQVLVSAVGTNEFVAGGVWLLGELFSTVPGLRDSLGPVEKSKAKEEKSSSKEKSKSKEKTVEGGEAEAEENKPYDPTKRDPQYAHAESSPLWELTLLTQHYHPTVALYAQQLIDGRPLTGSADLSLNTLSHFLDRFVYKNPKKVKAGEDGEEGGVGKGGSVMQPSASGWEGGGVKLVKGQQGKAKLGEGMVNEAAFARRKEGDVPVDQLFFHRFFTRKDEQKRVRDRKKDKGEDDDDDDDDEDEDDDDDAEEVSEDEEEGEAAQVDDEENSTDDEEEAEIWKAMKATMPKTVDDDLMLDSDAEDVSEDDDLPFDPEDFDDSDDDDEDEAESVKADGEDDEDGMSLVEGSDDEDLMPLDADNLSGLMDYPGGSSDEERPDDDGEEAEWGGISTTGGAQKRKRAEADDKKTKKKARKAMPTFASYEDYAKLIEDGPEDDI